MKKLFRLPLLYIVLSAAGCQVAMATEGGGGAYGNGSEAFLSGVLPPPGNYLVSYNTWYSANKFENDNPAFRNFKVDTYATILRYIHVTNKKILGGQWAMHAFLSWSDVDVKNLAGSHQNTAGLNDLIIDPIAIGWTFGNWHVISGVDMYLPAGNYSSDNIANNGRNYFTFEPLVDVTWLNEDGYEFTAKTMFDINTINHATDYQSGNELHADFVAAKHWGPLSAGIGGYYYKQVSNDSGSGAVFGAFRGRAVGLGPEVSYTTQQGISVTAKYLSEFAVQNRPEGHSVWINASMPL